jgi:hypothetical protein
MHQFLATLWNEEAGALDTSDWLVVAAVLVLGSSAGLVALYQALAGP